MFRTNSACQAFGRDEAHREPVGRVRAAEEVLHEELARVEIAPARPRAAARTTPGSSRWFFSHQIRSAGARLLDEELVLGRAAGVRRGDGGEGAAIGQRAFAPAQRVLDQRGGGEVRMDADGEKAVLDEGKALTRDCSRLGGHTLLVRSMRRGRPDRQPAAADRPERSTGRAFGATGMPCRARAAELGPGR